MALLALLIAIWLGIVAWRRRIEAGPPWKPVAWLAGGGMALAVVLLLADYESQKLAIRLVSPLGIAWLILFAIVLAHLRERQWQRASATAACWLLLTLGGNVWVGAWLLGRLEASVPTPDPGTKWDAVAVLGGGTELGPDGQPQLGDAGDRLRVAAKMLHDHQTSWLVTSGSGFFGRESERSLAAETAAIWEKWDVPASAVVQLPGPVNTKEEIAALAELAPARGWRRIGIVSSAWHLPRALALARRRGLAADGIPADIRGRTAPFSPVFLVPQGDGFQNVQHWLIEVVGRLVGR